MKLTDYISSLLVIVGKNPEYGQIQVIFAKDDEGNEFSPIGFEPSLGNYSEDRCFTQVENFDELDEEERTVNSICIN